MLINNDFKPNILTEIFDLFFPESCVNCSGRVQIPGTYLCFSCISELPLTGFTFISENRLETSFYGRLAIKAATSLFYFDKKSMIQKILHELKYRGKPEIGIFMGRWLAADMKLSKRFETLDAVIPVPLHHKKERRRGYNQVRLFAEALSEELNLEYLPNILIKKTDAQTQTKKNRVERILNEENDYEVQNAELLRGRHILLVDDIITSGATMEACGMALLQVDGIQLSLASMAFTT